MLLFTIGMYRTGDGLLHNLLCAAYPQERSIEVQVGQTMDVLIAIQSIDAGHVLMFCNMPTAANF